MQAQEHLEEMQAKAQEKEFNRHRVSAQQVLDKIETPKNKLAEQIALATGKDVPANLPFHFPHMCKLWIMSPHCRSFPPFPPPHFEKAVCRYSTHVESVIFHMGIKGA